MGQKLQAGPVGRFRHRRAQEVGVPGDWSWNGAEGRGGGVDGRQGPSRCSSYGLSTWDNWAASWHSGLRACGFPRNSPQRECSNKQVTTGIPFSDQDGESAQHHFHWPVLSVTRETEEARGKRNQTLPVTKEGARPQSHADGGVVFSFIYFY